MTQEHTPGEWHYTKYGDATVTIDSILKISSEEDDSGGFKNIRQRTICELNEPLGLEEEDYANARLIAAAPELLEALKKAAKELNEIRARDGVPYTHQGWKASVAEEYFSAVVDECFSAIAKAEGRNA